MTRNLLRANKQDGANRRQPLSFRERVSKAGVIVLWRRQLIGNVETEKIGTLTNAVIDEPR